MIGNITTAHEVKFFLPNEKNLMFAPVLVMGLKYNFRVFR